MISVNNGTEVWVGCGQDIVIVGVDGNNLERLQKVGVFAATTAAGRRQTVSALCCHGDQVWCLSRAGAAVVELDVESRLVVCILDCSLANPLNEIVANIEPNGDLINFNALTPMPSSGRCDSGKSSMATGLGKWSLDGLHRQFSEDSCPSGVSLRSRDCQFALRRKMSVFVRRRTRPTGFGLALMAADTTQHVSAFCYVKGTLWIGRSTGDVLVVNVTSSDTHRYEYGRVVAVLCNDQLAAAEKIDHLVYVNDERVVAVQTLKKEARLTGTGTCCSSQLAVWSAIGLDMVHQYQNVWNLLKWESNRMAVSNRIKLEHSVSSPTSLQ